MSDRDDLARPESERLADLGYQYAAMLESGGGTIGAGIVRRLADALREAARREPSPVQQATDRCRRCGAQLEQKPTGRPRRYCSDRCRKGRTKPAETQQWWWSETPRGRGRP